MIFLDIADHSFRSSKQVSFSTSRSPISTRLHLRALNWHLPVYILQHKNLDSVSLFPFRKSSARGAGLGRQLQLAKFVHVYFAVPMYDVHYPGPQFASMKVA